MVMGCGSLGSAEARAVVLDCVERDETAQWHTCTLNSDLSGPGKFIGTSKTMPSLCARAVVFTIVGFLKDDYDG